jgi:hypothetical protein
VGREPERGQEVSQPFLLTSDTKVLSLEAPMVTPRCFAVLMVSCSGLKKYLKKLHRGWVVCDVGVLQCTIAESKYLGVKLSRRWVVCVMYMV